MTFTLILVICHRTDSQWAGIDIALFIKLVNSEKGKIKEIGVSMVRGGNKIKSILFGISLCVLASACGRSPEQFSQLASSVPTPGPIVYGTSDGACIKYLNGEGTLDFIVPTTGQRFTATTPQQAINYVDLLYQPVVGLYIPPVGNAAINATIIYDFMLMGGVYIGTPPNEATLIASGMRQATHLDWKLCGKDIYDLVPLP